MNTLLIATHNPHKTKEIAALLGPSWAISDLTEYPELPVIEETGTTFQDNAHLKAIGISQRVSGLVLADDSGLEVDALNLSPGVYSARYGGEEGNHELNNKKLLHEMATHTHRTARFRCCMVLAQEGVALGSFNGLVEGSILSELRGNQGFGYDPLFVPDGYDRSFAELGATIKNTMSHRSRALEQVIHFLTPS